MDVNELTLTGLRRRVAELKAEQAILETAIKNIETAAAGQEITDHMRELTNAYANLDMRAIQEGWANISKSWYFCFQECSVSQTRRISYGFGTSSPEKERIYRT